MMYIHPHVSTNIIDNSFNLITVEGLTTLFAAMSADKGKDRELISVTSPSEYEYHFGQPNMIKHGQTQLNVYRWVEAGGRAYVVRVTDEAASFSHKVLELRVKVEEVEDPITSEFTKTLKIKTAAVNFEGVKAQEKSGIQLELSEQLTAEPEDDEGFVRYPFAIVTAGGRGSYYDNLGMRLSVDDSMDDTFSFRTYSLDIVERKASGSVAIIDGPFQVALSNDAISPLDRQNLSISEITEMYSKKAIRFELLDSVFDKLDEDLGIDVDLLDFVSGTKRVLQGTEEDIFEGSEYEVVEWVQEGTDYTDFSSMNFLAGGEDGDMTFENVDSLLTLAYSGALTPLVTDIDWTEIDVLLDANYVDTVKNAMVTLARDIRGDCLAIIDTGFTGSPEQAINKRRTSLTYNTFYAAIFTQDGIINDNFTKRQMRVTPTWILANKIPSNDRQFGTHRPFVGPRRGSIEGIAVSWFPTEPQKTELYKAQLNYIEQTPKRINLGTQLTSQVANSDLSNISVVRTIFQIIRRMRSVAQEFPFEFNNADTDAALQKELSGIGGEYVSNNACEYVKPSIITTEYERRRKICRVKVEMKFTALLERIVMDFIVQ